MGLVSARPPAEGEDAFLERLIATRDEAPDLKVPVGDDAAVVELPAETEVVVATDAIAEGSHFHPGTPFELVGRKALAVNLSDFAAMGAVPRFVFAAASLPRGFRATDADRVTAGLRALAHEHGLVLAGGDTIAHDGPLGLAVTVVGWVERGRAVTRSGARPGDLVAVTGALGGSLLRGRHLTFAPRLAEGRALARAGPPSAMMDVSDGLLLDLDRLCRRSGVGARVFAERVPVHPDAAGAADDPVERALSDGEDFELLFTAAPAALARIRAGWALPTPLNVCGEIVPGRGILLSRAGVETPVVPRGYEHR
jgi:thiamine-monophosphate kinase